MSTDATQAVLSVDEAGDVCRRLIDSMPMGVNVYRLEQPDDPGTLRFIVINRAADEMTGVPMGQFIGQMLSECMPAALETDAPHACVRAIRTGQTQQLPTLEYADARIPGSGRVFAVKAVPLGNEQVAVLFDDISRRVHAERAVHALNKQLAHKIEERDAANRELEAFAYSVSHDLRQPLRAIDGFSKELLQQYGEQLDERGKHYLGRICSGARMMGQLIDDLLGLSRINQHEMQLQPLDLVPLVARVIAQLRESEPQRIVELELPPSLAAEGDEALVGVLLANLLSNAWKFTGPVAHPTITLGVSEVDGRREFFVRDNGVGFDMAYADKLFGAFQRLHAPSEFPGTGIGLATAQRIVNRHGGSIRGESVVGQGATFYFTLGPAKSSQP